MKIVLQFLIFMSSSLLLISCSSQTGSASSKYQHNVRVAICASGPTENQKLNIPRQKCPDGQEVLRIIKPDKNVMPDFEDTDKLQYSSKTMSSMRVYLMDTGLVFLPEGLKLRRAKAGVPAEFETDTVFLDSTYTVFFNSHHIEGFDQRFKQVALDMRPITLNDGEHKGAYFPNMDRDHDFITYEYRIPNKELEENMPNPDEFLKPKDGAKIFFQCARVQISFDHTQHSDPLCRVEDFGRPYLMLEYNLHRSKIKEWKKYSNYLWQYVDSITENKENGAK